jgi:hypothetical protein
MQYRDNQKRDHRKLLCVGESVAEWGRKRSTVRLKTLWSLGKLARVSATYNLCGAALVLSHEPVSTNLELMCLRAGAAKKVRCNLREGTL